MKRLPLGGPARWRERNGDQHGLAARAALLADAASQAQPVASDALARILETVVARRPARGRWVLFGPTMHVRTASVMAVLVLCAATASGAAILWRRHVAARRPATSPLAAKLKTETTADHVHGRLSQLSSQPRATTPPASAAPPAFAAGEESTRQESAAPAVSRPARAPHKTSAAGHDEAEPPPSAVERRASGQPAPPAPVPERPALEPPPFESPSERVDGFRTSRNHPGDAVGRAELDLPRRGARSPAHAPGPAPARGETATEASLLAEAISALRRQDDPRAALALLDRHARAFPQARLGSEATRTRVEALVRLGDFETTLTLLDGMSDEAASLGADLLLTRAELRARGRRFRDALSDFTAVLEGTLGPLPAAAEERALYGRAVCLARLGRIEAARADLNSYAQRFPNGRFATEVRRLLAGEISPPQP